MVGQWKYRSHHPFLIQDKATFLITWEEEVALAIAVMGGAVVWDEAEAVEDSEITEVK